MNHQDFVRNFQSSWFGMPLHAVLPHLNAENRARVNPRVSPEAIAPCVRPRIEYIDPDRVRSLGFVAQIIIPTEEGYVRTSFASRFPWNDDLDETRFIVAKTPIVGMVKDDMGISYITTIPIRGTPRGFCPENCSIEKISHNMCGTDRARYGDFSNGLSEEGIWNVFNPEYSPLTGALADISAGNRLGAPIAKHLGVTLAKNRKYPILVYKTQPCGFFKDATTVHMYEDATAQCVRYVSKQIPWVSIT